MSVRRPSFSKIFSEIAWPIKANFYRKHLLKVGTNVFIYNPGHIMPIYGGKNLKKSSPEPVDGFQRNLVCSIGN